MTDIYHSGIKGQRKGVRRYQYANGTYTPEGNLRYRPPKGDTTEKVAKRLISGAVLGELSLVAAKKAQSQAASMSLPAIIASAKTTLASLNASKVAAGKAVVNAIMSIPTPVKAMALPLLAIGAGVAIGTAAMNIDEIVQNIKDIPWNKISNVAVSTGSSAVGIALSTVSGNPLPAVTGITISTLATLMDKS